MIPGFETAALKLIVEKRWRGWAMAEARNCSLDLEQGSGRDPGPRQLPHPPPHVTCWRWPRGARRPPEFPFEVPSSPSPLPETSRPYPALSRRFAARRTSVPDAPARTGDPALRRGDLRGEACPGPGVRGRAAAPPGSARAALPSQHRRACMHAACVMRDV